MFGEEDIYIIQDIFHHSEQVKSRQNDSCFLFLLYLNN